MVFSLFSTSFAANAVTHEITLSDSQILVDGSVISQSTNADVYTGANIVYYKDGQTSAYGEGTAADAHTATDAAKHTVLTITKAGTYRITGKLSAGQIAVDLGSDAAKDPSAVVTLILDNADITCSVAPAIIFYNVWESSSTTIAGANIIIADDSTNNMNGSYVARIYAEGTTKKLHKYDGAVYSKKTMVVSGETKGNGTLNIAAENEGLDTEMHLTINSGHINITAQNDGINTNEDGVSVTTINGGTLNVNAGLGAEGDGIDSNGSLIINGGNITAMTSGRSMDSGIDADQGIKINGGTVLALGMMLDKIDTSSSQASMSMSYASKQKANSNIKITTSTGKELINYTAKNPYQMIVFSSPDLKVGSEYTVYSGTSKMQYQGTSTGGGMNFNGPRPEMPSGQAINGGKPPQMPTGGAMEMRGQPPQIGQDQNNIATTAPASTVFKIETLTASFAKVAPSGATVDFSDVPATHKNATAIEFVKQKGLMSGVAENKFSPDTSLTRAMFVTVLGKVSGVTVNHNVTTAFTDVKADGWSTGYIKWSNENKIISGYGNGKFGQADSITRKDAITILNKYAESNDITVTFADTTSAAKLTRGEAAELIMTLVTAMQQ